MTRQRVLRRTIVLSVILVLVVMVSAPAGAVGRHRRGPLITAITQNLYIGADIGRLTMPVSECALTPDPAGCSMIVQAGAILDEIRSTDFTERAKKLAQLIRLRQPHVIGLQEVTTLTVQPINPSGALEVSDYLAIFLDELNRSGPGYEVAGVVNNVATPWIPTGRLTPGGLVVETMSSVADRDVILVRSDVETGPATSASYGTNLSVPLPGGSLEFTRGWVSVDVTVEGETVTVFNTHLEPQYDTPATIPANAIQTAQAAELMGVAGGVDGPTLLLGDFNSDPDVDNGLPLVPTPYEVISGAGFTDLWTKRLFPSPGNTCCQASDLRNRHSQLDERIDLVWFRGPEGPPNLAQGEAFGDTMVEKTKSGLWPSDHAGVVVRFFLP